MNVLTETAVGTARRCHVCGRAAVDGKRSPSKPAPCRHCGYLTCFRLHEDRDFVVLDLLPNGDWRQADIVLAGESLIGRGSVRTIIVNFSLAGVINASLLAGLQILRHRAAAAQVRLILCGLDGWSGASFGWPDAVDATSPLTQTERPPSG
jgi:hypothetical protein